MAATKNEELQLSATQKAADQLYQQATAVSPAETTQSYYTKKSTANNYENNAPVYEQSDAVKEAAAAVAAKEKNKPGAYQSQYSGQIQALLNQALNRSSFNYDFSKDSMYGMYADKYQQQGKQAMNSAVAASSALTGGYANSWAQTAGQQAYQQYMTSLNDVIPELRNAAYQKYTDEGNTISNNLGLLQSQESSDYGRYRDTVTDYQSELQYLYNKSNDMTEQEYNRYQNDLAAWESDRAYWYQREQDALTRAAAAASSRKGGGGGGSGKTASTGGSIPTTYSEFVALTGQSGVMTKDEYLRRNNGGDYAAYLKTMWAKYM